MALPLIDFMKVAIKGAKNQGDQLQPIVWLAFFLEILTIARRIYTRFNQMKSYILLQLITGSGGLLIRCDTILTMDALTRFSILSVQV